MKLWAAERTVVRAEPVEVQYKGGFRGEGENETSRSAAVSDEVAKNHISKNSMFE